MPTARLQQLLREIARENKAAFEELVWFYNPVLLRYGRTTGYPIEDVKEAIQDTFESVWNRPTAFQFGSKFSVYLIQVLRNKLTDKFRANKRHQVTSDIDELADTLADDAHWADPMAQAESLRAHEQYLRCKEKLTTIQQEIVFWMYEMQATETEASSALNCEVGTVKSRYSAARQALRQCLQGWYQEMRHG